MNVLDDFHTLLRALEASPATVVTASAAPQVAPATTVSAASSMGLTLPRSLVDLYAATGALRLEWEYEGRLNHPHNHPDTTYDLLGRIEIRPVHEVFGTVPGENPWEPVLYNPTWDTDVDRSYLHDFRPLDWFDRDASGCVGLRVDPDGTVQDRLYLYSLDCPDFVDLETTVSDYLETVFRTAGLLDIRYAWCSGPSLADAQAVAAMLGDRDRPEGRRR